MKLTLLCMVAHRRHWKQTAERFWPGMSQAAYESFWEHDMVCLKCGRAWTERR